MRLIILILFSFVLSKNDYFLTEGKYLDSTRTKFEGILEFKNPTFNAKDYNIEFQNKSSLTPIKKLKINLDLECNEVIHLKITDKEKERWEPSNYTISSEYKEKVKKCKSSIPLKSNGIYINENKSEPFSFKIIKNKETILSSEKGNFLYSEYFLTLGFYLTSNNIYGFGERYHNLSLGDGIFTTNPNDTGGIYEDDGTGGYNLMGHQPLGFHKTLNGKFLGILFNNINVQDLYINSTIIKNKTYFEHRTIGGIIEYYFVYGNTPDEVIIKLHEIIGRPIVPPFWSLGYHQCRWGYYNEFDFEYVTKQFKKYKIPVDTFWMDLDLMENNRIFSIDKNKFLNFDKILERLHKEHFHFVPLIDLGFPINYGDPYYNLGTRKNAFIMSNYTKNELIGIVWPGNACFPDFFIDEAIEVWDYAMNLYYQDVKYDGIWIDMNEPAQLIAYENNRAELLDYENTSNFYDPMFNEYEYIPYIPGFKGYFNEDTSIIEYCDRCDIRSHTISENAYSHLITENKFLTTYNMKPLIGLLQGKYTNEGLKKLKKRPFVISRETVIGSNKYIFHWLGDNHSNFKDMRQSLNGIFNFQIFGIPMTGDDICGFFYDSNDKLCSRWFSLGSLYPFSRNHKILEAIQQEPFAFYERNESENKTLNMAIYALRIRYSLLRFFYTEIFKISIGKSGSFFKPVFFNYPHDNTLYENIDLSLMLGKTFIFFPIFSENIDDLLGYFPNDDWNDIEGKIILNKKLEDNKGKYINLNADFLAHNLYIRGGEIFPRQETFVEPIKNTHDLRNRRLEIIVNPDSITHQAKGDLIFDNDDDIDPIKSKDYYYIRINFINNHLIFKIINEMKSKYNYRDDLLSYIKFYRLNYLKNYESLYLTILTYNEKFYIQLQNLGDSKFIANLTQYNISVFNVRYSKIECNNSENNKIFNDSLN